MSNKDQQQLFDNPPAWTEHWQGMPEYKMQDITPIRSLQIHFKTQADVVAFQQATGLRITSETKSLWFPLPTFGKGLPVDQVQGEVVQPRYPIFVISKGRWERRLTASALDEMGISYSIVVEPQEYENYAAVMDPAKILTLPFSNLGQGSIPARNWVWQFAEDCGAEKHWILDDNIDGFVRQNENKRIRERTSICFTAIEDFVDRYQRIALAGMNYRFLGGGAASDRIPPILVNTRVYSCILIDHALPHRWRGRYNEDTDLSIRALKDGWNTVLFNAFKINKQATMTMKGGNTDELYKEDGRLKMAESLRDQHPDIVKITQKWNRWQHHVDYSGFKKNKLIFKPGVVIPEGSDDYGMRLHVDADDQQREVSDDTENLFTGGDHANAS